MRDAVVVVQHHQLVEQAQRAGQRRQASWLMPFHQAAVADEDIGAVVDHGVRQSRLNSARQQLLGQRHADRVGQALAQRTGGGFHARR